MDEADTTHRASGLELLARAAKHYKVFWSGFAAGLLGFGLPAIGVPKVPLHVLGWVGVALMALAVFMSFHDVRVERDGYKEKLKPVFELSDSGDACFQRGSHKTSHVPYQLRRLIVTNGGGTTVDGVKASVVGIRYHDEDGDMGHHQDVLPMLPLPLIPQHARDVNAEYVFSLAPNESRPIDVADIREGSAVFTIMHSVPGIRAELTRIGDPFYLLDVQVVGRNVPSTTRTARLFIENGKLQLTLFSR